MKMQSSEKGQVLVFIILALAVIFGFAALAVDGGQIYSERRRMQSAVDSAALGAAYAAADGKGKSAVEKVALNLAAQNGFANDPQEVANGVPMDQRKVVVQYFNPPQSGPYKDNTLYHQVQITERVDPIFAQLINGGEPRITVEAVTFSTVNCNCFAVGNVLHAMNPTAGAALEFDGGVEVYSERGNIFSNSSAPNSGVKKGGSGSIKVDDGKVWVVGKWDGKTENVSPNPIEGVPPQDMPQTPIPACEDAPAGTINGNRLSPGKYEDGIKINGGEWFMEPGMYCVYGANKGFTVNGNATLTGDGVFIAMMEGEMKLNGGGKVDLTRANDLKDGKGNQWGGMLVYAPSSNTKGVALSGGNNSIFSGTIFAPGAQCSIGGNNITLGIHANVICDTIKIHGNARINFDYIPEQNWQLSGMIQLMQ